MSVNLTTGPRNPAIQNVPITVTARTNRQPIRGEMAAHHEAHQAAAVNLNQTVLQEAVAAAEAIKSNSMKKNSKIYFTLAWTLFIAIAMSGCYTVIMHTQVEIAEKDTDVHASVSHRSECISCHDESFDPYDYAFERHETPFDEKSSWVIYYENNSPWWYGSSVETDSDDENAESSNDNTNTARHYGRRRSALNEQNTTNSYTPSVSAGSGTSFIPIYNSSMAASSSSDSNRSNQQSAGDNSQNGSNAQKNNSDNKKRNYGERRTTKKKEKQ